MRTHQIVIPKHNPYFRLQQDILKKTIFFQGRKRQRQEKAKKTFKLLIVLLKFLILSFYKDCRNEITTRYQQCRCQTKPSEGILDENGGHYKTD